MVDPQTPEEVSTAEDEIVLPPPPELRAVADALEGAIGSYVSAFAMLGAGGTWEALDEAGLMLLLMIRNIEGVILLSRRDLVLLPGAMVMARSAFETGVAVRWMLDPDDPYEREMRWLRMCRAHEDYYRRMADRIESLGGDPSRFRELAELLSQFHIGVAAALPEPHRSKYDHAKPPPVDRMLADLG